MKHQTRIPRILVPDHDSGPRHLKCTDTMSTTYCHFIVVHLTIRGQIMTKKKRKHKQKNRTLLTYAYMEVKSCGDYRLITVPRRRNRRQRQALVSS